ncbi:MAG TPA: tRNA pseudouridine(38-40) synthase TruA [Thermodesulfobacteriota bacterium]|nr:tRNA pseudouridine(38-40) synthase TruA [Thermodesulfobacteriota bacterium]
MAIGFLKKMLFLPTHFGEDPKFNEELCNKTAGNYPVKLMRNLKLVIEYDGTNYQGWQSQKNGHTIQDVLEAALSRIMNEKIRLIGSGRTDSGVHALGQVANFKTKSALDTNALFKGANSLLPTDILIKSIEEVPENFHARFSAKSRIYEYRIWNASQPSVFYRSFSWWVQIPLNVELMHQAAFSLIGWRDFSSFQGADHEKVSPEREVMEAGFRQEGPEVIFFIQANAFLRHMVRNIIGTIVEVGKSKMSPQEFVEIMEARDRTKAGKTAPAQGLFLKEVCY